MKSIKNIFLLLLLVSLASCESDNNIPINENTEQGDTNPFLENFGADIQARFIGTVVNEQNNPIVGAEIKIGTSSTITDPNGVFSIEDATVFEKFAYVEASKEGFINGSRSLVPTDGVNQVKIMLLSIEPTAIIATGTALTIDLPDGTEVDLPADYETEFGLSYVGNVSVTVKSLSIDNEDMPLQMPGSLLAENSDGDLRVLETYGMISVELRGDDGQELNISSPATIRIPVGSNATNPPATIPLWFFDEANGYWKEEGVATLEGTRYVGEVSHFSFWNCDANFETVDFCATIVDENNNPIPNILVQITTDVATWSPTTSGYTNGNGEVCGLIPANETLILTIPDFGCIDNSITNSIGPYSDNQNITITASDSNALITTFNATLNDCDGNAITNGYLQFFYNNQSNIVPVTNGMISEVIEYCATDSAYTVQLVDIANGQSSDVVSGDFMSPTTNLASQMSCNTLGDADSDGVLDINEDINGDNNLDNDDTDQDGTPDYLDTDDDGDGINTVDEDYDGDGNPMNEDSDGDTIPDYLDEQDVNVFSIEVPNTSGCDPDYVFDFDIIVANQYSTLINNTYAFYLTQADADTDTNQLASPYTANFGANGQEIFVRATNTVTNQWAIAFAYLFEGFIDTDGDGLSDCEEISGIDNGFGCNPNGNMTDPNDEDSDDDGFNDCVEANAGTDPNNVSDFPTTDTDGDGVIDGIEITNGTDPNDPCDYNTADVTLTQSGAWLAGDCDGDGVTNEDELLDGTDPNISCEFDIASITLPQSTTWLADDCDDDNVSNGIEFALGDTDADGLPNFNDPDDDNDGINTIDEDTNGNGDPTDDDTDGDGIPDYLDNN